MNQLIEEFRLSLKPKEITRAKLKRLIKSAEELDNFDDRYDAADHIIEDKLPEDIKQTIKDTFMGSGPVYQNAINLLYVVKMIVTDVIEVTRKEITPFTPAAPNSFRNIHHDYDGSKTAAIIGIIKSQIGEFKWIVPIWHYDGCVIVNGKDYAFVELGWINPYRVREFLDYYRNDEELWLFPYQEGTKEIAPYYFIVGKGSKIEQRSRIICS